MSDKTVKLPLVRISTVHNTDSETGLPGCNLVIDVIEEITAEGEVSAGFVVLEDIDDIFVLKDAVDSFISRHNLTPPTA